MSTKYGLFILAVAFLSTSHADINSTKRYPLPTSKFYLETCRQEALTAHPGVIQTLKIFHRQVFVGVRYEIETKDHSEWFVLCDLANGKITKEQKWFFDVS